MSSHAERMLVIDKDDNCRHYLSDGLLAVGYYVVSVKNIKEALVSIANGRPDLIFGDLSSDEISLLSKLKDPQFPPSPVIAFSHTDNASDVVTALRAGASDFIIKPIKDFSLVEEVIKRIFEQIRLVRLNQRYRVELEDANRELKAGIAELKADQKAGLKVQMKMLPEREKKLKGIKCNHLIKPSLYLSGDFLDYFKIDSTKAIFYIADVSGHGSSSAFVTVLLKNLSNRLLRNFKRGSTDDILYPDKILHRINRELLENDFGKHLTMFVGVLENDTNKLTYSVGAHFPMPVLVVDGKAEYLEGTGMPVGLFEDPTYRVYDRVLPQKFDLWMFSDGILEVIKADSLAEKEQKLLTLVENSGHSIESLAESVQLNEMNELPDDIAILTVSGVDNQDG
ncbi:PP2C family protein-serine/threonine phosphatase [Alkalimarinus coralli]|uniref:PP2C family protein-serine/threonine phosphatase n=1 Tax=Alkalimarinus coralli TaxID=2935863 RepID=UPI00202B0A37|nr:SpoIIE family protein phosphatase [Alkalimarinus coralli]